MYRDLLRPAPAGEGLGRRACHSARAHRAAGALRDRDPRARGRTACMPVAH